MAWNMKKDQRWKKTNNWPEKLCFFRNGFGIHWMPTHWTSGFYKFLLLYYGHIFGQRQIRGNKKQGNFHLKTIHYKRFMNIKLDYCKCIRIYKKAHLRSHFWQSIDYKYMLPKYYFVAGQKFIHVSHNEWSLGIQLLNYFLSCAELQATSRASNCCLVRFRLNIFPDRHFLLILVSKKIIEPII